jgi:hypothetical protein
MWLKEEGPASADWAQLRQNAANSCSAMRELAAGSASDSLTGVRAGSSEFPYNATARMAGRD